MTILAVSDFAPKIQKNVGDGPYLQRGDDRYSELGENFEIPLDKLRPSNGISKKVKRYLVLFVSKEYARDRLGTDINQGFDGQVVDHWKTIFDAYDEEENQRLQELSAYDFLTDEERGETNSYTPHSIEILRG